MSSGWWYLHILVSLDSPIHIGRYSNQLVRWWQHLDAWLFQCLWLLYSPLSQGNGFSSQKPCCAAWCSSALTWWYSTGNILRWQLRTWKIIWRSCVIPMMFSDNSVAENLPRKFRKFQNGAYFGQIVLKKEWHNWRNLSSAAMCHSVDEDTLTINAYIVQYPVNKLDFELAKIHLLNHFCSCILQVANHLYVCSELPTKLAINLKQLYWQSNFLEAAFQILQTHVQNDVFQYGNKKANTGKWHHDDDMVSTTLPINQMTKTPQPDFKTPDD